MTAGRVSIGTIEQKSVKITFSHPKSNSLTEALLSKLASAIETTGKNPEVHSIVLQSDSPKTFCAGASFNELIALKNQTDAEKFFSGFAHVITAQRLCPCPIICRVQGKAVGGALGIIAASDYCLATKKADLRLSELAIGIGPFVIASVLQRKIGHAHFANAALDTQWRSAAWAHSVGLYAEVFDSESDLDSAIAANVQRFSNCSYASLVAFKKLLWEGSEEMHISMLERAKHSASLVLNPDTQSILKTFLQAKTNI